MRDQVQHQVKRRRVFFVPGYDPIHPRRYRELYRKESAIQAQISNYTIALKPKALTSDNFGWSVTAQIESGDVDVDVEVLVWSDLVRDSMNTSIWATYMQLFHTAWIYISTGTLSRLMQLRKGPVIAALYPVAMLLFQLTLALVVTVLIARLGAGTLTPWIGVLGGVLSTVVGLVGGIAVLRWWKVNDNRFYAYYLMNDYAFSSSRKGANPPELETRLAAFVEVIAASLIEDVDEVLVVGHSSGAHLGVSILADLIRSGRVPANGPVLSFLSLGQVVPMVSFLPDAHRLRADLTFLSVRRELTWMDVTAPGDGGSFALCDPVAVTGVAPKDKKWPLVFSAAYTKSLSEARLKELRWHFFRLHFQYLCAFDRPRDFDYFKITAGPKTLGARYAKKPASRSRIDHAVNKFTSISA